MNEHTRGRGTCVHQRLVAVQIDMLPGCYSFQYFLWNVFAVILFAQ